MSKKEELEAKMIEAAVQEFMAKGLDSGSMENIAKIAEVSKRTLYKYYPNKEEIFDAIIEKLLIAVCATILDSYSKSESIEKQLTKIIDYKAALMISPEYLNISRLVLCEVIKGRKFGPKHLERFYTSELHFIKWIDAAKKDGKITSKQPSELIANQFHSIIKGQLFYPVIFGMKELSKSDIKTAKKIAIDFFLNSFCK
jgi:TetR/AcrR family transcriptional regulator of autoinduction and epiphytic fitness